MINYKEIFEIDPFSLTRNQKDKWYLKNIKKLTNYHIKKSKDYKKICNQLFNKNANWNNIDNLPYLHVSAFKNFEIKSADSSKITSTYKSSGTSSSKKSKIFFDQKTSLLQTQALKKIFSKILYNKKKLFIVDSKENIEIRNSFSAKSAATNGFAINFPKKEYLLNSNNEIKLNNILKINNSKNFVIFGFTSQIWFNLVQNLKKRKIKIKKNNGIVIHGGGWKKLHDKAISNKSFKKELKEILGVKNVYNYYGMMEQTGSVFLECEYGFFHSSIFSDVIFRDKNLNTCSIKEKGLVQIMSLLPLSYPGHNILSEDLGRLEGIDNCKCGRQGKYFSILGRVPNSELRGCSDI